VAGFWLGRNVVNIYHTSSSSQSSSSTGLNALTWAFVVSATRRARGVLGSRAPGGADASAEAMRPGAAREFKPSVLERLGFTGMGRPDFAHGSANHL